MGLNMMKLCEEKINEYLISNDKKLLSYDKIYEFLSKSYWANNRSKEAINNSIKHSECFGVYLKNEQVGFARVVTDYSVIYWLCDVYIDENFRKKGLGKKLVEVIINNEELKNLTGMLGTNDAYSLYEKYGFIKVPEGFMRRKINL
jgi:GNAT superfamily N-acetyltransferase